LSEAAASAGLPLSMNHFGSCLNLYFSESVPESSVVRTDAAIIDRFHVAAMNRGLFLAPRGMMALSTVMTTEHIAAALQIAAAAMQDVASELGNLEVP
jgi:glutamate-1-semialdehyde aminotransferase